MLEFLWAQWAQLGVSAPTEKQDSWAADPEALILLTFEVARNDPRLFDEVLDWLALNGRLLSQTRLRNLAAGDHERALIDAALGWASAHGSIRTRSASPTHTPREPTPLFHRSRRTSRVDPIFHAYGFERPKVDPSKKSRPPELHAPINFAFRLRQVFGVGARAEVIRHLLTVRVPWIGTLAIADSAGYAKRNVNDALAGLAEAGAITGISRGKERLFTIDSVAWSAALGIESLPTSRNWPAISWSLRTLARWLDDDRVAGLSDYLRASEARTVMDAVTHRLRSAGVIGVEGVEPSGPAYWDEFVRRTDAVLDELGQGLPFG